MNDDSTGIVYVLTNPAMNGLVKIGKTLKKDVEARMKELYTTGVPLPFKCEYACCVDANIYSDVEKAFHIAFNPYRINDNREFFRIDPEQAIALMKILDKGVNDVTSEVEAEISGLLNQNDKNAIEKERKRRPNLNFIEMSIPIGSNLYYTLDLNLSCKVIGEKKILFNEQEMSLSALTNQLLGKSYGYGVIPTKYWTYNGQLLYDLYNTTYENY